MMIDITVTIITYNHVQFIERALKSVLDQETSLSIEILVGDDGSTDGTSEIVKRYEDLYPKKITAFYHDRSQVIYVNDRPTAKHNYLNNLKHAKGKYVAILEGDDYWTANNKLQKQWDFLEKNPDCSTCFHAVELFNDVNKTSWVERPVNIKDRYNLKDLIPDNFIHTCSVMFRHNKEQKVPEWFYKTTFGDWAQHLLRSLNGDIGYIDQCMSTYRLHAGGRWSTYQTTKKIKESIEVLEYFNQYTEQKYAVDIKSAIQRFEYNLVLKLLDIGDIDEARNQFKKLSKHPKNDRGIPILDYIYIRLCVSIPIINTLLTTPLKWLRKRI